MLVFASEAGFNDPGALVAECHVFGRERVVIGNDEELAVELVKRLTREKKLVNLPSEEVQAMITSQLLSPRDFLTLSEEQLSSIDVILEAEIIKSDECLKLLREKLDRDYLPAIRELEKQKQSQ
jgi:hypothetical protein